MPDNPHVDAPLRRYGAPLASARGAVILVHGRAQAPADMEAMVARRLDLPDIAYVAPAADGGTWYPGGFMAPFEQNEPRLGFALARLAAVSDELAAAGFPAGKQAVIGFSQGACLACELVYRRRRRFAALIAFTGGLLGPAGTTWRADTDAFRDMPILLGGGTADPWVPAGRMLETAEVFRALRADVAVKLYAGLGHEIGDEQIADARALVARMLRRDVAADAGSP